MSLTPEQIQYFEEHASDSLVPNFLAAYTIGLAFAYLLVGLRIYARKLGKAPFGHDDWLIIAALVPLSTYAIVGYIQLTFGEGRHVIFVTNLAGFIQGYVTAIVAYAICVVLTKLSILCFYCRIFFPTKQLYYISWGFGIFIVAYNLALIFVAAFQCIPLSSLWTGAPAKCIDTLPPYTALGIVNVVTDAGILALPIRYILKLRLSLTRRIQVCGIFLLGALVTVFGIVRVVTLAQAAPGDPSYNQAPSGYWSFAEIAIGIVAACLPTIAVLATRSYFTRVSTSVIHLVSLTFRRSRGSSGNNTRTSGNRDRETRRDENEFSQLSEVSLARGPSSDSRKYMHQGHGDVSTYVAGNLVERGESDLDHDPSGIIVKNEVVQTFH
ncbi:hypothetical protein ONZ43_g6347 [Nemania bipapillata]|uniref:Uncharacterized protein n=1 Tax=Nemania bipapillata TaxID=110536 RepID=A0ACC2I0G2_9PEZI|nr:hypothetical protein ONZ43_g6347 [Nemania bipapillata]